MVWSGGSSKRMLRLSTVVLLTAAAASAGPYDFDEPTTLPDRQTVVQLFSWRWTDVANECENFLQHFGYGAVQVSPPNEHIIFRVNGDVPWYVRYQPVSYQLNSMSGNAQQFADMVHRCNHVGVRVIVDTVINHMVAVGQKDGVDNHHSSGGSTYDGTDGVELFPGVPYGPNDFNDRTCHHDIHNYHDPQEVRECRLLGLLDLNQGTQYVRGKMVEYMNHLIDLGVGGFRVDACKHMWPADLHAIFQGLKPLRSDIFGPQKKAFIYQEVIDLGGEPITFGDYTGNGRVTQFKYGKDVSEAVRHEKNFKYFGVFGAGFGYGADHDNLVFIDDHDNQRSDPAVLSFHHGQQYSLASGFMLAWPFGLPRVMSSYAFSNRDHGPPANSPVIRPQDNTCDLSSGWICEHRWQTIRRMNLFRAATMGAAVTDVATDEHRIAFGRLQKGFFVLNNDPNGQVWSATLQTRLPAGVYCDVYLGGANGHACTGVAVSVGSDGRAAFRVPAATIVAIHLRARPAPLPLPRLARAAQDWQTTAILIHRPTGIGQNVFARGGIDSHHRGGCHRPAGMDPCAIRIHHITRVPFNFKTYKFWSQNDNHLDWYGPEDGQGTYDGIKAQGSPLAYSTNDHGAIEYQPLNEYGPDYWMAVLRMDCSQTVDGWFEVKGFDGTGFEPSVSQIPTCRGGLQFSKPYTTGNHFGKCGFVNVFQWGMSDCIIDHVH